MNKKLYNIPAQFAQLFKMAKKIFFSEYILYFENIFKNMRIISLTLHNIFIFIFYLNI